MVVTGVAGIIRAVISSGQAAGLSNVKIAANLHALAAKSAGPAADVIKKAAVTVQTKGAAIAKAATK
ncbi:MAG: hypothetical protein KGH62_01975 [Candidatus Micrarchaeota archaeon]|nr:hypothetical protein [Candidatus Micrarchaeota archaeon]